MARGLGNATNKTQRAVCVFVCRKAVGTYSSVCMISFLYVTKCHACPALPTFNMTHDCNTQ